MRGKSKRRFRNPDPDHSMQCHHKNAWREGRYVYCPTCLCSWYFPEHMHSLFNNEVKLKQFKEKEKVSCNSRRSNTETGVA